MELFTNGSPIKNWHDNTFFVGLMEFHDREYANYNTHSRNDKDASQIFF